MHIREALKRHAMYRNLSSCGFYTKSRKPSLRLRRLMCGWASPFRGQSPVSSGLRPPLTE
jgi:hypothetical protein